MKKLILFSIYFFCAYSIWAQVSGTVTDESGAPLFGVSVLVEDSSRGTVTDIDGRYQIDASANEVLQFSYIGMEMQSIQVGGQSVIDVQMSSDALLIDEVVINAFGLEENEKELGYAVQSVKSEDLNLAGNINPLESLQGRVAGVQINRSSGSAGGGVDILIRGVSSVNPGRNNQPLIIVDGLPLNNDTFTGSVLPSAGSNATGSSEQFSFSNRAGDLNPDDIESFNVLKGAAATALYGIRAANGAIVITTKKGAGGKPKINLSASTTVRDVAKVPTWQTVYREGHRTSKLPAIEDPSGSFNYLYYAGFSFYAWGVPYTDDSFTLDDGTVIDLSNDRYYDPNDIFRTGVNSQLNLNISGASDKFDYFFSGGHSSDKGIVPNTEFDKINFRFKGGYQLADNLRLNSSIAFSNSGGSRGINGDKSIYSSLSYWAATYDINDYVWPDGSEKNYSDGIIDNPRYLAEKSNLTDDVDRWVGSARLIYDPTDWLNVNYSIQVDNYSDIRNRFVPPDVDVGTQVGGFVNNENINFNGFESILLATAETELSSEIGASLTLGHQVSDTRRDYTFIRGEGLNVPGINEISNTLNLFGNTTLVRNRNVGVFGDLRLDYSDRIFLSITGRNDWISEMPAANRSFFYPSVSLSGIFHDLIDADADKLSFGKLRLSWAQVGKGPNFGQVGQYFIKDPAFPFGGAGGYRASTLLGDLNLVPEKSNTLEIGTDLRFMDNRFRVDYTYYNTQVSDQIFPVGAAYSSGLSSVVRNAGDYKTWGHELLLSGYVVNNSNFRWEAIVNWSTNASEVTAIPDDLDEIVFFSDRIINKAKVGDELGTLYGYPFQTTPSGARYVGPDGKWVVTGSENEGFYYEGDNEPVIVGNAFPDYILSLTNQFQYKGLGLNFLIEYKKGGDLYDRGLRNSIRNGNSILTLERDVTRPLEGEMDDGNGGYTTNTIPVDITANNFYRDTDNYNAASDVLLQDGSWLKLRTLGLSYNLPPQLLSDVGLSRVTINATVGNIILWTPFDGYDPESNQFSAGSNIYGFTGLTAPLTQNYSLGFNVEF